ncbi:MAG: DUF378 domain-containing protein [Planctomycetota bacterium]|nr:DUF378 domain-containing protein [Planctomycetota bacterium]
MKVLDVIAAVLLVIGGLNWGLVGALKFDLVAWIFGSDTAVVARIIYCLVGVAALYQIVSLRMIQKRWGVRATPAAA